MKTSLHFIDLFAGLGGFHVALKQLGFECVFASEINPSLAKLYTENFGLTVQGDIHTISSDLIPSHDILCAGFPCQPFSKAGYQQGEKDFHGRGKLFEEIVRILKDKKPQFFILENVPNLLYHNQGSTWKDMKAVLEDIGYAVDHTILSPHEFGIPQHRLRMFIVGDRKGLKDFSFPLPHKDFHHSLSFYLDKQTLARPIGKREKECLDLWQTILDALPNNAPLPLPLWSMEFNATYPYEDNIPLNLSSQELSQYTGSFGQSLKGFSKEHQITLLPRYAQHNVGRSQEVSPLKYPQWKKNFIRKNRVFYRKHENILKPFIPHLKNLHHSWQKFEWNCGNAPRNLKKCLIQIRASGIRVKKPDYFPSIVTTSTQIPIIGWEERYISAREAAKLQYLETITLPSSEVAAFAALGNAVNAYIVQKIAAKLVYRKKLIEYSSDDCISDASQYLVSDLILPL